MGWIGVDLDGTLAKYDGWKGAHHIGAPIPKMVARVKNWLANGQEVKIFTARVSSQNNVLNRFVAIHTIEDWCLKYLGKKLPITATKDFDMTELYDDRAIQIVQNTGERVDGKE